MTTTRVSQIVALVLLVCGLGTAHAQDRRFGLTMGYPAAVGVLWHVTDRIAVRPEIDLSRITVTTDSTSTLLPDERDESTSRLIRPGLSLLLYVGRLDGLRTYVSPRFSYTSARTSQSDASGDPETSTYLASGSFGVQHLLGERFAVFGEVGIEYSRSTFRVTAPPLLDIATRRTTVGTRSGAGVVLFF